MFRRKAVKKPHSWLRRMIFLVIFLSILVGGGIVAVRHAYYDGLGPVNANLTTKIFVVEKGSTVKQIAQGLETAHLIRSAWAFQLYVHSKQLNDKLQAGTYALSPNQGTAKIVAQLTRGQVKTDLITIYPGERIDQVRADLINHGFDPAAVDRALNPAAYTDLPALAFKPAQITTLEGLLWPDSYQRQADTDPAIIIRQSLMEMGQHLTPEVQAAFTAEGLTTYQGLILTSILVQEVTRPADQAQAAQVFLSRQKVNMPLGSDPTARYGAIAAGRTPSLTYDSPYNTLLHAGFPPTPIGSITAIALAAATHPAPTQWLYFVSGDDGTTYFSKTLEEHEALTQKYCHKLCQ